jgi:5-methylcytosine-specific restriction endonuclease McrA
MAKYMANRRKDRRVKLIQMAGSACKECGSTKQLEFDHRDPAKLSFRLSGAGLDRAWSVILEEFQKCDLLCESCHEEKTSRESENGQVPHGGGLSGKKNCPCEPCKVRKREYMRGYVRPSRR